VLHVSDSSSARADRIPHLGGARSGKSAYAEGLAAEAGPVRYLATAIPDPADLDFAERVARHRDRAAPSTGPSSKAPTPQRFSPTPPAEGTPSSTISAPG